MSLDLLLPVFDAMPWDWAAERFGFSPRYRGALFLLAGGMFIATLIIVTLLFVHILTPGNGNPYALSHRPRGKTRVSRPIEPQSVAGPSTLGDTVEQGRAAALALPPPRVLDDVFDAAVDRGLGEPRVLHTTATFKRLRFYTCAACAHTDADQGIMSGGCAFTRGFLQASFERFLGGTPVHVAEAECRLRGAPYCEFDIVYGEPALSKTPARKGVKAR
ncbi:MAG TPA: V4R domain-containing protein [Candidatus Thermoplasmatota archaeon]|nr:V4R domain-containing protein [Candidatus Thermoplasmatota archaeon]